MSSDIYAIQDANKRAGLLAHDGTSNTADLVRLVSTAAGALTVDIVSGDTIEITVGTLNTIGTVGVIQDGTVSTVEGGSIVAGLQTINSLVPDVYDYISLSYGTTNLLGTAVFKNGGSGGTTVSTLALGYDGSDNLTSVTKS